MVPMNEDLNIYDGSRIEGSSEAKSRSTWVEMFDMIGRNICSFIKLSKNSMIYELLSFGQNSVETFSRHPDKMLQKCFTLS